MCECVCICVYVYMCVCIFPLSVSYHTYHTKFTLTMTFLDLDLVGLGGTNWHCELEHNLQSLQDHAQETADQTACCSLDYK